MDKNKYNIFNLSQPHKELFSKYISYVKHKEGVFIREVLSYVDDFKNEK